MPRIRLRTLAAGTLLAALPLVPAPARAETSESCTPTASTVVPATASGGFHPFGPVRLADTRQSLGALGAGCTLAVDVPPGIPAAATAVVLSVTADRTGAAGFLTVHPCGSARPDVSNVNVRAGAPTANLAVAALDATRRVCVYTSAATDLIVDVSGYLGPNGSAFQEIAPRRAVDTRFAASRPGDGTGPVGPGVLTIPNSFLGVPTDAVGVIVNVTATQAGSSGYLTAFPCTAAVPDTSNVNFVGGEDRANQALVGLSGDGSLCVFASAATHVIVDVTGVFAGSEGLPFSPSVGSRLVDSRNSVGGWTTPIAAGETRAVDPAALPAGSRSVVVNVLATRAGAAGYLTVFPCGSAPSTSSVNFSPGHDVSNLVAMATSAADGGLCVYSSARTDVVIDLFGAFSSTGLLRTLSFGPGTPPITPAFQPDIRDYAARCGAGINAFDVRALGMPGTAVNLDGAAGGQAAARVVAKAENQAVVVTVAGLGGASDAYWIRCLPHDFPPLTVDRPGQPAPGWYLVSNIRFSPMPDGYGNFVMILDEHGTPVWYRRATAIDFKRLSTGQLAWILPTGGAFGLTQDGAYEVHHLDGTTVRTVKTAPPVPTDHHDLVLLPNGNFLLIGYVERPVASPAVECHDGNIPFSQQSTTRVVDSYIQEVSPAGVAVWSWNSRDHFDPQETIVKACFQVPDGGYVYDPVHVNSVDAAPNGDIIVSARHLDAVCLIDKASGAVKWKMGGTPSNHDHAQILSFVNDPEGGIARQHDAKMLPSGHISLFDNRTNLSFAPIAGSARAAEYAIDTNAGTATLVRARARPDGFFSGAMGSAQWLDGGGVLAGWGALTPVLTEFDAAGDPLYSVSFPPGHFSYRAVKEPPGGFSVDALRATAGH